MDSKLGHHAGKQKFKEIKGMTYLFESDHLRFRKFEITDAKRLYENHLEEEVMKILQRQKVLSNFI